jgi:predicted ribosome quality control (RQC) complex YloA/Tae2 family protein
MTEPSPIKISFDSLCLACALTELEPWDGARVERVVPTGPTSLALGLYLGAEAWIGISWSKRFPRLHLLAARPESFGEPPELVLQLRRRLKGAQLVRAQQAGWDRVARLTFEGPEGSCTLIAELTGRHAGVVVVDRGNTVVAADRFIGPSLSVRPILPGKPYSPPPGPELPPLSAAGPGDDVLGFEGGSPALKRVLRVMSSQERAWAQIRSRSWTPVLIPGSGPYPLDVPGGLPRPSFGVACDLWYRQQEEKELVDQARSGLVKSLERVVLARETALRDIAEATETGRKAGQLQWQAEMILAYQGMIGEGAEEVAVWDMEGRMSTIPLLADLTPLENAQRLFEKAKKSKARMGEVADQGERLSEDLKAILSLTARLEQATTLEEVAELKGLALEKKWLHAGGQALPKEERPWEGHQIRELLSPGGWRVLYGLNATSNDYLTTKVAKPNDWWLHVRGAPSSHVVIATGNQPLRVQKADLVFAAEVSIRHSPTKHSGYVAVDYTLKKYVRKPRKSAPGFAAYTMEKTLHIEPGRTASTS